MSQWLAFYLKATLYKIRFLSSFGYQRSKQLFIYVSTCLGILSKGVLCCTAMGMGLCVAFIAFVRLPSLKVSTLLLTGLLIYDVFWVFFSSYIFNTNVMVKVLQISFILHLQISFVQVHGAPRITIRASGRADYKYTYTLCP